MEENVIQINSGIMTNVDASVKNIMYVKKDYIWNPATCSGGNEKYLASIMDDSAITYGEIIESYNEETNFNEKKVTCKTQNFTCIFIYY